MILRRDMWLLLLLTLCGLMLGRDGGSLGAPLHGPEHRTHITGLVALKALRDVLPEEGSLCASETEELCTDRRSHFNLNPFGLRFGKRHSSSTYRRALRHATSLHLPLRGLRPELMPT